MPVLVLCYRLSPYPAPLAVLPSPAAHSQRCASAGVSARGTQDLGAHCLGDLLQGVHLVSRYLQGVRETCRVLCLLLPASSHPQGSLVGSLQ
eukprot:767662-Hanusia_phi.AAC.13